MSQIQCPYFPPLRQLDLICSHASQARTLKMRACLW